MVFVLCSCCGSTRLLSFRNMSVAGWPAAGTSAASTPLSTFSAASAGWRPGVSWRSWRSRLALWSTSRSWTKAWRTRSCSYRGRSTNRWDIRRRCMYFLLCFCLFTFFICFFFFICPEQRQSVAQRKAGQSGEFLLNRERENARRAWPTARCGGGRQEQDEPGVFTAGGTGETEERAESHTAGEEDHRGLGTDLQGRDGDSKTSRLFTSVHVCSRGLLSTLTYLEINLTEIPQT